MLLLASCTAIAVLLRVYLQFAVSPCNLLAACTFTCGTVLLLHYTQLFTHVPLAPLSLLVCVLLLLLHCSPGFQKSQAEFAGKRVPIGRLGTTADIAYAAVYLCSDTAAGYVSGHTLVVDGAEVRACTIDYYCSNYAAMRCSSNIHSKRTTCAMCADHPKHTLISAVASCTSAALSQRLTASSCSLWQCASFGTLCLTTRVKPQIRFSV
jgi:Enoyl-(Acyl carrier protein) reductase